LYITCITHDFRNQQKKGENIYSTGIIVEICKWT